MAGNFSIASARDKFPGLKRQQVYFDNAGGSQILGDVAASIYEYLIESNVQLGATYSVGQESSAKYKAGYEAAAAFINASPSEIVIGPSTTQLFRNLSLALHFPPGSELILSKADHEANISSWLALASSQNLTVKWWLPSTPRTPPGFTSNPAPNLNPKMEIAGLKELLTEKTRLVAVTHASNILGSIHDVKGIVDAVHAVPGAMVVVDAVAFAPHRVVDVKALGVDFYAFSWYKVFGPHISMLYGSEKVFDQVGSLGHYFNPSSTLEYKLGLAASNYELAASLPKLLAYFGGKESLTSSFDAIAAHEEKLAEVLLSYLRGRKDAVIYGEPVADRKLRVPTISFTIRGHSSKTVVEGVEKVSDFGFRWGAMYSNRLVEEVLGLGKEGVVRVSMLHYNTVEEIERFVEVLEGAFPSPK